MGFILSFGNKSGKDKTAEDKLLDTAASLVDLLKDAKDEKNALTAKLGEAVQIMDDQERDNHALQRQIQGMEIHHTDLHSENDGLRATNRTLRQQNRVNVDLITRLRATLAEHDIIDPTIEIDDIGQEASSQEPATVA